MAAVSSQVEPCTTARRLKTTAERAEAANSRREAMKAAVAGCAVRMQDGQACPRLPPVGTLPHEIDVKTEWGLLLDVAHPALAVRQVDDCEIYLIEALFSADECAMLLEQSERHGYGSTNYPKGYRGNLRLTTTDDTLAEAIWRRLQPLVPPTLSCDGAAWDAVGLNESWRLAKYHPGDRFMSHCDASFERSRTERTMFTVNVYMNEGFTGGSTRFYLTDPDSNKADLAVAPKTGLCLLFRQPPGQGYRHDGEQLESGVKYLFRSDVMYRRRG